MDYPKHGKRLKVHGTPWQFSETPARIGIAPELGEHNEEVLQSIGYMTADIVRLREEKII
jgi:crotonobetainyl-CoA:carnitine CoA-transferase CaiB-like acyl-CoA transferase